MSKEPEKLTFESDIYVDEKTHFSFSPPIDGLYWVDGELIYFKNGNPVPRDQNKDTKA